MPFTYQPGTIPVLLSAPHGAAHRRNGRLKVEDEYTAAFVRLVAAETGSHIIYTRYQSDTDPNWDRQTPYKEQLRQIIREHQIAFVLDIHGMSNRHKIGLAVGTINGRSCPRHESCIVRVLENGRFKQTTTLAIRTNNAGRRTVGIADDAGWGGGAAAGGGGANAGGAFD